MHLRILFVSMILVAACGKGKDGDGGKKSSSSKSDRPTNKDVTSLFTGATVTLPPEVAKASFDAKKADILKAVGTDSGYLSSKTHADTSYDLRFSRADNLDSITVTTRGTKLEPILTKQWGPPIKLAKGELFWFNPAAGMRAWIPDGEGEIVKFSRYEPITTLLGPKGFDLAFAKDKALFGASLDELHTAWGAKLCDWDRQSETIKKSYAENVKDSNYPLDNYNLQLRLCPGYSRTVEEYSPSADTIHMGLDQKVFAISMSFPVGGSPDLIAQLVKQLDDKFGTPTELTEGDGKARYYFDPATKRRAIVKVSKDYVNLSVAPYMPAAELIGDASKPGLSIETPSMVGGTFEQIGKEDAAHFRTKGTLHSLVYPPTEWSFFQTEIELSFWDKDPKAYGYRAVVHFTNNPAGGDAVFELLKAKYGEPKKTTGDDKDKTFSFAKGNRKLAARRVSEQWQLMVTK